VWSKKLNGSNDGNCPSFHDKAAECAIFDGCACS
jgi:hypothetical protein